MRRAGGGRWWSSCRKKRLKIKRRGRERARKKSLMERENSEMMRSEFLRSEEKP